MRLGEQDLINFMGQSLGVDTTDIETDSPLFSSGVIDSFALVSLMTHLEKTCGIRIAPFDVTLENFDSLGRIMTYISRTSPQ